MIKVSHNLIANKKNKNRSDQSGQQQYKMRDKEK